MKYYYIGHTILRKTLKNIYVFFLNLVVRKVIKLFMQLSTILIKRVKRDHLKLNYLEVLIYFQFF